MIYWNQFTNESREIMDKKFDKFKEASRCMIALVDEMRFNTKN